VNMANSKLSLQHQLPCETESLTQIIGQLLQIRSEMLRMEASYKHIDKIFPAHRKSAQNLLHYMALRMFDVRELQIQLSDWGMSSLGRAERKVQATLDTVINVAHKLDGKDWKPKEQPPFCFRDGRRMLEENTTALLGDYPSGRRVRIMVTMPTEAAGDYRLVYDLLENGMNCARINCAHDDPGVWQKIINNIRRAEDATGRRCKIHMDLGGPKLRTGMLEPGPAVVKVRPQRSPKGDVLEPGRIWFYPEENRGELPPDAAAYLPVPGDWLAQCKAGDRIELTDARGASRRLRVEEANETGMWVSTTKTVYFVPGTGLRINPKKRKVKNKTARLVGELPRKEPYLQLFTGDLLLLTKSAEPGRNAQYDEFGNLIHPASIGCSIPDVLDDVQLGEPIWFDDGKIGGIIEKVEPEQVHVRITQARDNGERLRSEKGINLPDTDLRLPALTKEDISDLQFVVQYADMVGLSFANSARDVEDLIENMRQLKKDHPAIVLKIETRRGFDNLPAMLLAAMQAPVAGVMIARGDLAIECGFGRLAEVQEQILWICEAAHVPAIWATQVLEGLAKEGLPTRAEVTDAAMGQRAECIMLNKGDHIVDATRALDDILRRMQDHQTKKRSLLRKLHLSEKFFLKMGDLELAH
jgi:pyruvate kinase